MSRHAQRPAPASGLTLLAIGGAYALAATAMTQPVAVASFTGLALVHGAWGIRWVLR